MHDTEWCIKEYGSYYNVEKKVSDGELFKLDKGVYSKERSVPELAILSFKYPNAVATMHTAFSLYGLTDTIPDAYDLATTRNAAKIKDTRVKQYFVDEEYFNKGIEYIDMKGYSIPIYSKERMLIELIRYKTKLPFDYYKEIILNYRKELPKLNIQEIQDLAMEAPKSNKIMGILQTEVF